jgi:hypothetical protein
MARGNRLTDAEARQLGLAHLIPKRGAGGAVTGKNEKGQNKLEARFDRKLADEKHAGIIADYWFEEVKFRLAYKLHYTPDFVVALPDWTMRVFEVKGVWRDDARCKIKMAAAKYPHIRWVAVRWIGREWVYETFPSGRSAS